MLRQKESNKLYKQQNTTHASKLSILVHSKQPSNR